MEYLAVAVVFGILFGCFTFLDGKRKDQQREINGLYETISRQNDRLSVLQEDRDAVVRDVKALRDAVPALETQVREMSETVKARDRQEQMVLEGMHNILNYDMAQARKAVNGNGGDE